MRKSSAPTLIMGAIVVLAAACDLDGSRDREESSVDSEAPAGVESEPETLGPLTLPGFATFGHEVRAFRPCGSEESLWAIDSTGSLWDLHREFAPGQEPYEEVFAVVEGIPGPPLEDGFGADFPGTLVVKEVLFAAREGLGCDSGWSGFSYRASGNEPFWTVEISPEGMEVLRLGEEARSWNLTREERVGDTILFTGQDPDGASIQVRLLQEQCRDSMSGAYFGFTASVRLGTEQLTGCATRGAHPG